MFIQGTVGNGQKNITKKMCHELKTTHTYFDICYEIIPRH